MFIKTVNGKKSGDEMVAKIATSNKNKKFKEENIEGGEEGEEEGGIIIRRGCS